MRTWFGSPASIRGLLAGVLFAAPSEARADPEPPHRTPEAPPAGLHRPECGTIAGYGESLAALAETLELAYLRVAATLLPQSGARWERADRDPLSGALSWPMSIPFGPPAMRNVHEHRCVPPTVEEHRPHRVVVEPGFTFGGRPTGFGRAGYRFVWHPASSKWGLGAGLGSTIEIFAPGDAKPRPSLSPELLVHFGSCCRPGYRQGLRPRHPRPSSRCALARVT